MKLLAFSVTGTVLPSSVRLPATAAIRSPSKLKSVPVKRALGLRAASRKSALRRCLSKSAMPELMEAVSMSISARPVRALRSSTT